MTEITTLTARSASANANANANSLNQLLELHFQGIWDACTLLASAEAKMACLAASEVSSDIADTAQLVRMAREKAAAFVNDLNDNGFA